MATNRLRAPRIYNPDAHYWIVNGDESQLWSSASDSYVTPSDVGYLAFLAAGGVATRAPTRPIPAEVTMRQARLALLEAGLLASVATALAALTEPSKTVAGIEWEYSQSVQRENAFVAILGAALSLTTDQLDDLFIAARRK